MGNVLVIITNKAESNRREEDSAPCLNVSRVAQLQREIPDQKVEVLDFTQSEPNYDEALEKIFTADSVQVW